jgi:hypothetical protein
VAKGLRCQYQISVPYSAPGNLAVHVERLNRFVRALADAAKGVWVDEQSGEVWRGERRIAREPQEETDDPDEVRFSWIVPANAVTGDELDIYVDACRRLLPEALPRRYGDYDPLPHRFDTGMDDLRNFWKAAPVDMNFTSTGPCASGGLIDTQKPGRAWSIDLYADRHALESVLWQERFRALFLELVERWRCIYAAAEVIRWDLWRRAQRKEPSFTSISRGGWIGLPPYPVWWSYYGDIFMPLVERHLTAERLSRRRNGIFYEAADRPLDRDELNLLGLGWPPDELRWQIKDVNPTEDVTPEAVPAIRIPEGINRPPPSS